MTKPRDILKGKVKRLLREKEDMGQLCDPAVDNCVSALEAFVHDIGRRLKSQAETTGVSVITPIELKRCVLASQELAFLHDKVQAIDESDAKYHKPQSTRKRKADPASAAEAKVKKSPSIKSKRKSKSDDSDAAAQVAETETGSRKPQTKATTKGTAPQAPTVEAPKAVEIEEDVNYDSSDSD